MTETKHRILLVDDDVDTLEMLAILLEDTFDVTTAAGGRQALDEASGTDFDAIVLDLMMPRVDGEAVIRELRERECATPVILVSALAEVRQRARELGAFGGERKPVDPSRLAELIQRAIASGGPDGGPSGSWSGPGPSSDEPPSNESGGAFAPPHAWRTPTSVDEAPASTISAGAPRGSRSSLPTALRRRRRWTASCRPHLT